MDERLFDAIQEAANEKGIPPTSLVVGNLEDLYLKDESSNYDALLKKICQEAQQMPIGKPFLLAELPSFTDLVVLTAKKAHISPSPIRARVGKSFRAAVSNGKVGNVERAMNGGKLMNKAGVAMYVNAGKENT